MKYIISLLFFGLITACSTKQFQYRKPVIGYVYIKDHAMPAVIVRYDSTDVLSRQDIVTDETGRFIMPKVTLKDYQEFRRMSAGINSWLNFYKDGKKIFSVDLKKYNISNDTINIGKINIE